jgi:exodeoxyribonuclease VII small subunit
MSGTAHEEPPVEKLSFEEAMRELERVVSQLEAGDVALEDSIRLYERGAKLKAHCEARLKAAEEKVAAITLDESGQPKGAEPVDLT